ncbi:MAG: BTAD domain-containing putative transcriptional regulator [Caldilineaceae bacterium]
MPLSIYLLGSLSVWHSGQPVNLPTRKAGLLLAYLALHADQPVSRVRLADYLWPESSSPRTNLRAEFARLRSAVGDTDSPPRHFVVDRHTIQLRSDQATIDFLVIQRLLDECDAHQHPATQSCSICGEKMALAIDLYAAPLLDSFSDSPAPEMEAEVEALRLGLEERILVGLTKLQLHLARLGDHERVIRYANRHLALRPLLEEPTERLIMALILSNNRPGALAAYQQFSDGLAAEFGLKPSPRLVELYKQIHARQINPPSNQPSDQPDRSPYPGLSAFGLEHSANFYGRETTIDRLRAVVCQQPLVLLTGPSGSGKSSVINAGLLPALHDQTAEGHTRWKIASFRPGREPLQNLAQAIYPALGGEEASHRLKAALQNPDADLRSIITDALTPLSLDRQIAPSRILLIADQFEEIFTLSTDEKVQRLLLNGLFGSSGDTTKDLSILIVLRADFLGQALAHHSLSSLAPDHLILLGRMDNDQLRRAIEKPARQNGITYEPGLIERILADLDNAPGQLPLLQFTLALLWERRSERWITNEAYSNIEQVSGALTHYANGVVARLSLDEQQRVRRIFLQLVHPNETMEDTRRLAARSEIGEVDWPLVHRLADSRLVVTNQDIDGHETVEVIHEALIQEWGMLREWLSEDRAFHLWQTRTRPALQMWLRQGKDPDALLRGLILAEAERWWQERGDDWDVSLAEFIRASVQARIEREKQADKSRRKLEMALEESRRMERRAMARQLGAQANQLMQRNCDLALLLAAEALERSDQPQDRTDLLTTLDINPFLKRILHGHQSPVFYLSFSADGTSLISSDERNQVQIWQTANYSSKPLLPSEHEPTDDVALDPTGRWFATVHGQQIALWQTATLTSRRLIPDHTEAIFRLRFSVDGRYLLSIATDGALTLWETESGRLLPPSPPLPEAASTQVGPNGDMLATLENVGQKLGVRLQQRQTGAALTPPLLGHRESIHGLALNPDGSRLATASFDGTVRLWDTQTGRETTDPLSAHTGRALFAGFSPDGSILATGGTDNHLFLWDVESGRQLKTGPFSHSNWVRCAAFSADGSLLASGDSSGKIYLWDLARHRGLTGHSKRVRTVAVSRDGQTLATASLDGSIRLWDTSTFETKQRLAAPSGEECLAGRFSPDGRIFVGLTNRGSLLLWDTETWQPIATSPNPHNEPSIALAFSRDSRLLAQGDLNGLVSLWDVRTGQIVQPPRQLHTGSVAWVLALAFSPDGTRVATGGKDCTIALWSVPDLTPIRPAIPAHTNWVTDLLYTADGETLISTGADGTVRFWNPHTGEEQGEPLTGHQGQVWQAEFSPVHGESVLLTLGGDGTVLWWDMQSRTPLAPALRMGVETESMALSPDGHWLYLASFDNTSHTWRLPQAVWAERCRRIANRSLTDGEWRTYLGYTRPRT